MIATNMVDVLGVVPPVKPDPTQASVPGLKFKLRPA